MIEYPLENDDWIKKSDGKGQQKDTACHLEGQIYVHLEWAGPDRWIL